jgi:alkylated DNA repair dioxygenase AlkB
MHQGDLFEDLGPAVDAGFTTRRRIELDRTSRLTAEYEDISAAPQPLLHTITATLAQHYGVAYRYLWLNLYRTHRDSTSWHGDPIGKIQETSTVPVLSLGATRRFPIKAARD